MKMKVFLYIVCCELVLRVICDPNGYYCTGSNHGNLYLKCIRIPCNGTLCETIVDYVDENGPDVMLDSNHKVLVNLEIKNVSIIHVLFINYVRHSTNLNHPMYRLIKPIVLKVQLSKPGELYNLRFINYVNGGPTEEVISKNTRENYFGCDSGRIHPTCGMQFYGLGEPLPFSEGFCCSCLESVNIARQPKSFGLHNRSTNDVSTVKHNRLRGEQDCTNISSSPGYANPFTYHESSHCFRYSDLWFNVYKVDTSKTFLPSTVELYEKNEKSFHVLQRERSSTSVDGERIVSKDMASYRFKIKGFNETVDNDLTAMFVLIPQDVPEMYRYGLPNLTDEPGKYLVVHPSWISINGTECDKIGVRPQAFYEQPDRCYRPQGSCLGGQPIHLLQRATGGDFRDRRSVNERLFVEDYVRGEVRFDDSTEQLIVNGRVSADVNGDDGVSVQGEIRLDENAVIGDRAMLQISEIHAVFDENRDDVVKVRVYVTNLGLKTAEFFVDISDRDSQDRLREIVHPQQTAEIFLPFECHANDYYPTVRLYDAVAGATAVAVASRKFSIVRGRRCYCQWHRRCECYRSGPSPGPPYVPNRGGDALDQREYGEAGFLGDVPPGTEADEAAARDRETLADSVVLLAGYVAAALALGLIKALSPFRSHWLWMVSSDWPSEFDEYKEPELRQFPPVRDDRGYYVHPVTKSRNIRLLDRSQEFVANVCFFVNLPATLCRYLHVGSEHAASDCSNCASEPLLPDNSRHAMTVHRCSRISVSSKSR